METYEETPQWAERQRALLRAIAAAESQLYAEMDAESTAEFMNWALGVPKQMATTRRVFGVARKPLRRVVVLLEDGRPQAVGAQPPGTTRGGSRARRQSASPHHHHWS